MKQTAFANTKQIFDLKTSSGKHDFLSKDTVETRFLAQLEAGGLRHCTVPPGMVSSPVRHKAVDELWYCLSGHGEIWQANNGDIQVESFGPGDSFTVPAGNAFQFRNHGESNLCVLIATIPR